jgi:hypothetical protein
MQRGWIDEILVGPTPAARRAPLGDVDAGFAEAVGVVSSSYTRHFSHPGS